MGNIEKLLEFFDIFQSKLLERKVIIWEISKNY